MQTVVDITDFLATKGVRRGCFKITWEPAKGMKYSDEFVFDRFAGYFVLCDDYGFSENRATVRCTKILSVEKV